MEKLIILEGPDASGKTTLANNLVADCNAVYLHCTYRKEFETPKAIEAYFQEMLRMAMSNVKLGKYVVMDRCWISEGIYRNATRPETFSYSQAANLDFVLGLLTREAGLKGAQLVFCKGDCTRYNANVDPAHPYKIEQYKKIISYYTVEETYIRGLGHINCHSWDIKNDRPGYYTNFLKQLTED